MNKENYTVAEVRALLGCSREKSYQIIHSKGFPTVQIGRQYYIPIDKYNKWFENHLNSSVLL